MTRTNFSFLRFLLLWLAAALAVPASAQTPTNITPQLIAENSAPAPGGTTTLALLMTPKPTWHGYWKNGGDAGFGLTVEWDLPDGVTVAPFAYPVPEPLVLFGLMNHVYERPYALLARVNLADSIAPGTDLSFSGKALWLACTDEVCVPEEAMIAVKLTAGTRGSVAKTDPRFDGWRAALPPLLDRIGRWQRKGDMLRVAIPLPENVAIGSPHLFVATANLFDYGAPQKFSRNGDWLVIETRSKGIATGPAEALLRLEGARGLEVRLKPGAVPVAGKPLMMTADGIDWALFGWALGGAVLGGLLLNLMPCVFPILSLKALSLARAGGDARDAKVEALAYLAGALTVALALGGVLLALRAGGAEIGWAFQLQHPLSVFLLLLLTIAITANLLGWFELPSFGGGDALTRAGGAKGGFATGALAAFVATPCSGPFMGAALGATLALPVAAALPIFGGLGLGLALPFVAIAYSPALRTRLPKPGAWMVTFRKWLALPMALTALGLTWLLWQQVAVDRSSPSAIAAQATTAFSPEKLAAARASGKPVFVNFTADWCITCKVNEQTSLNNAAVQAAFDKAGVVQLTGDWTNGDPVITRALAEQGRNSLPLYLWYAPGGDKPQILPQILTPTLLTELVEAR
jgi:DsbC/DsbD-like thiol-disulfide interchange protein/cytochrome c biogenesis protein CcdA